MSADRPCRLGFLYPPCGAEDELYRYVEANNSGLLDEIMQKKTLDDKLKSEMTRVIKEAREQRKQQAEDTTPPE